MQQLQFCPVNQVQHWGNTITQTRTQNGKLETGIEFLNFKVN